MVDVTVEDLKQLLADGRHALEYAWDHYEELVARESAYTLYGPYAYGIGAAMPGKFISNHKRKLTKRTRRKDYMIYELDSEYRLLRTRFVLDNKTLDCIYHCFDLNGIQYACPFLVTQKKVYRDEVLAIAYADNTPQYLAFLRTHSLLLEFFEDLSSEKMAVTSCYYSPQAIYTRHGYPVDLNAPIGALNSPVQFAHWEEDVICTDFSKWFEKDSSD